MSFVSCLTPPAVPLQLPSPSSHSSRRSSSASLSLVSLLPPFLFIFPLPRLTPPAVPLHLPTPVSLLPPFLFSFPLSSHSSRRSSSLPSHSSIQNFLTFLQLLLSAGFSLSGSYLLLLFVLIPSSFAFTFFAMYSVHVCSLNT